MDPFLFLHNGITHRDQPHPLRDVELRTALDGIYQGKILAEASGGEREPVKK